MPLKHRQDGVGGEGNLCVHAATDSGGVLQDRSRETASTSKTVTIPPVAPAHGPEKCEAVFRKIMPEQ